MARTRLCVTYQVGVGVDLDIASHVDHVLEAVEVKYAGVAIDRECAVDPLYVADRRHLEGSLPRVRAIELERPVPNAREPGGRPGSAEKPQCRGGAPQVKTIQKMYDARCERPRGEREGRTRHRCERTVITVPCNGQSTREKDREDLARIRTREWIFEEGGNNFLNRPVP